MSAYRRKILELYKSEHNLDQPKVVETEKPTIVVGPKKEVVSNEKSLEEAFEFSLSIKKNIVSGKKHIGYAGRVKALKLFISKQYPDVKYINQLTKNTVKNTVI